MGAVSHFLFFWKPQARFCPHSTLTGSTGLLSARDAFCVQDFVVDLREESPTYLQWTCAELSAENLVQMYVPPRCGHGFLSRFGVGCTVPHKSPA